VKLVSAIVRTPKLRDVEDALIARGIPDVTVTSVAGFAGRKMLGRKELTPHSKVEVILPESQAEAVAECICEAACTGLSGDGIIVMAPIEKVVKIKQWRSRHGVCGDEVRE
jgi:nitrogen regulatory protein P-II 1